MRDKDLSYIEFLGFIISGLVIRALYSSFSFQVGDLESWKYFGNSLFIYHMSPFMWWSQGPLNGIPLLFFQKINYLGLSNNPYVLSMLHHIPFIVGDIFLTAVAYKVFSLYLPEKRYFATIMVWLNPLLIFVSSVKGQTEQYMVGFTILALLALSTDKLARGFFSLGCAVAVKYMPILLAPYILFTHGLNKRVVFFSFLVLAPTLIGFLLMHYINVIFYHDHHFLRYFMDRAGTIFGNFVPNLGSVFVGTGSSIWGELRQANVVDVSTLNFIKGKWLVIYALYYVSFFSGLVISRKHVVNASGRNKIIFLTGIYSALTLPFLLLYPQTVDHRFLNLMIPALIGCLIMELDDLLSLLNILCILVIFAGDIYSKGSLFLLSGLTPLACTILWIALFIPTFMLIANKRNFFLLLSSLVVLCSLFYLGDNNMHYLMFFMNYLLLAPWVIIFLMRALREKINYVPNI